MCRRAAIAKTKQLALASFNRDVINVNVKFGSVSPTCSLSGNLIGSADPELKRCEPFGDTAGAICTSDDDCEDDDGCSDEVCNCEQVVDTTPPELHCAVAKHVLEILNHNLVNVGLAATSQDQCQGTLPITVKVFGDEREAAAGGPMGDHRAA